MELVETAQVIEQQVQSGANCGYFEVAMDDNVQHWNKSKAHIAEVDGQGSSVRTRCLFGRKLLRVFAMESEVFLMPNKKTLN